MTIASDLIAAYGMEPLSFEGGWFRRVWESAPEFPGGPLRASAITYLMRACDCSRWHRLTGEEVWFYHSGLPVVQLLISPEGKMVRRLLGACPEHGAIPCSAVPANWWQTSVPYCSAEADPDKNYSLCGTVVVPGFEDASFTGSDNGEISQMFPACADAIRAFSLRRFD